MAIASIAEKIHNTTIRVVHFSATIATVLPTKTHPKKSLVFFNKMDFMTGNP